MSSNFIVCIFLRVISENFSQLPLNIYKREPNGDTNIAHDFHVQKLLKRPNRYMTPTEFKRNQILSILIDGNRYSCGGAGSDPWQVCVGYQEIPDCSL
jgi:phage portal protein BeeE